MLPVGELIPLSVGFSLLAVLIISSVTDLAWHRIPNILLLSALVLALILQASGDGLDGMRSAAAGLLVGLAFLMPLYAMGGMGAGDVKLLGVVGAFLGPWGALVAGVAALIAGAILGVAYIAWRSIQPALAYQVWRLTQSNNAWNARTPAPSYVDSPIRGSGFAYAPAIAAGAVFAMWQQGLLSL
jgi:prepilin peptidase CpaA